MGVHLELKPIKVSKKFLSEAKMQRAIRNTIKGAAEDVRIDFGVAVQTWKRSVKFRIKIIGEDERLVYTTDKIFKFVSGGTRIRYATMSPDWISKTQPNVLGSGPGQGRMLYVNKNKPRPGIKARMFAHIIVEKWNPRLPQLFIQNIHNELQH